MAKYEIMLVVDGTLDVTSAKSSIKELTDLIDKSQDYKETNLGLKTLAYKINKLDKGHYFLYNFESEVPATIAEFRRLALINKNVLRHLIINQEKDYGWRAINNPKKVKRSAAKLVRYKETQERRAREYEIREKARAELSSMDSAKRETNE